MKWEVIKDYVGREVRTRIAGGWDFETCATMFRDLVACGYDSVRGRVHNDDGETVARIYADKAWDIIQAWDIRAAGRLRELFPWAWPKGLSGPLVCDLNERGDWEVMRA